MAEKSRLINSFKSALSTALLFITSFSFQALAVPTVDYYRCVARVGGEYAFGRAPMACNASSFGDDKFAEGQFAPLIFKDLLARTPERERYSQEMHSFLREAATYYIKKRNPAATATEISWWVLAVQVTASHESYWSHYRRASDSKLKLMRGDSGHGHGLMQIDDRHHFPAITNGTAWNVSGHVTYAMDLLYSSWTKAPSASCVGSATNYEARVRAAWAVYNGGSGNHCRWTNPGSRWAQNDRRFYEHLKARPYEAYVAVKNKPSTLNVPCLMEKQENCPARGPAATPELKPGVLYQTSEGLTCVINDGRGYCVDQVRDSICLQSIIGFSTKAAVQITAPLLTRYAPVTVDRHKICKLYEPSLMAVGSTVETRKPINLRSTPGGGLLALVPEKESLEVLDFELRNAPANDRYYKVRYQNKVGFPFGGSSTDHESWLISSHQAALASVAKAGERLRIVAKVGINLRATAGGALLLNVPPGTELSVLGVSVQGSENRIYYKVTHQGTTGFIYSGLLLPTNTTAEWTQVLR